MTYHPYQSNCTCPSCENERRAILLGNPRQPESKLARQRRENHKKMCQLRIDECRQCQMIADIEDEQRGAL